MEGNGPGGMEGNGPSGTGGNGPSGTGGNGPSGMGGNGPSGMGGNGPSGMGGNGPSGMGGNGSAVIEGNDSRSLANMRNRVRELRENRLMTQAQLARRAKVALRTIHSVEKGMNCRMDTKRKILLALGLRFEDKDQVFPPAYPDIVPGYPREF